MAAISSSSFRYFYFDADFLCASRFNSSSSRRGFHSCQARLADTLSFVISPPLFSQRRAPSRRSRERADDASFRSYFLLRHGAAASLSALRKRRFQRRHSRCLRFADYFTFHTPPLHYCLLILFSRFAAARLRQEAASRCFIEFSMRMASRMPPFRRAFCTR